MTAGAIPFLALAPPIAQSLPFLPADLVANAALLQLGYGASIASFLGGIHWAMAMAEYGGEIFTFSLLACALLLAVQHATWRWCICLLKSAALWQQCQAHSGRRPGEGYARVARGLLAFASDRLFTGRYVNLQAQLPVLGWPASGISGA